MKYFNYTITKYLSELESKKPSPGGGSASALVSAIGVGCLIKVVNYTINKDGYKKYQKKLKNFLVQLKKIKRKLLEYVDKDAKLFEKVALVYKMPKNTDREKVCRAKKLHQCLVEVNKVGEKVIKYNFAAIKISKELFKIGNKNLISDTVCGTVFLAKGAEASLMNIITNAKFIKESSKKVRFFIKLNDKIKDVCDTIVVEFLKYEKIF